MPMAYRIDRDVGIVRIVGSGRVTDDEMVDCVSSLRTDPDLTPEMFTLSDMRKIQVDLSTSGVLRMQEIMQNSPVGRSGSRVAIVVDSDSAYGMGRMVELRNEGTRQPAFRVFRDLAAAEAWLGI
jgi:hypothetical protein